MYLLAIHFRKAYSKSICRSSLGQPCISLRPDFAYRNLCNFTNTTYTYKEYRYSVSRTSILLHAYLCLYFATVILTTSYVIMCGWTKQNISNIWALFIDPNLDYFWAWKQESSRRYSFLHINHCFYLIFSMDQKWLHTCTKVALIYFRTLRKWSAILGISFSAWCWLPRESLLWGQVHLGNQHHTEKLSQRIALHFHKVLK